MELIKVKTKIGNFELRKPTAGIRNRVIAKVDTPEGVKQSTAVIELLPTCVVTHPFGTKRPLRQAMDEMDMEEYDKLMEKFLELLKPKGEADLKKSPGLSDGTKVQT